MAFFDRMKDSLTTAGQEVSQKAKNATENVRLGNLIKNNDKMVDITDILQELMNEIKK